MVPDMFLDLSFSPFLFSLLVALFKRRKTEQPPLQDLLPIASSPPLWLSSRSSSSLMTELLAGDMKAAFSPPPSPRKHMKRRAGKGDELWKNTLPCVIFVLGKTFIKKLILGSGSCQPGCPPDTDDDTSLTIAGQYTFHISFGAKGNHPRQRGRIFTFQSARCSSPSVDERGFVGKTSRTVWCM